MREDPKDTNIIYVGTDNGLYVSFNKGKEYEACLGKLPRVAIHDIAMQARENEMLIATHGRSIYKTTLTDIQKLLDNRKFNLKIMPIKNLDFNTNWGSSWAAYAEVNKPKIKIIFYTKDSTNYEIKINNEKGKTLKTISGKAHKGYNYIEYNAQTSITEKMHKGEDNLYYLNPGKYTMVIKQQANADKCTMEIIKPKE